jgi:DNA anti-recombination protein RmuC
MVGLICGVAGLLVGAVVTWAFSIKHAQSLHDGASQAKADLAVRDSQLFAANEMLVRERNEHDSSLQNMELTFENMSNRVLAATVEQFNLSQEHVLKERDSKLDLTLKPLETLLDEYKKNLVEFNREHTGALFDVKTRATELLQAQQKTQDETRRLNQLLGRGDQRGHWGEVQLTNVMEASGLRRNIDYELQVSGVNDAGR